MLIERAIGMGRVVCTADPAEAAARDAAMLAERRAGRQPPLAAPPTIADGCLMKGAPGAGEVFPQPWAQADGAEPARLDDVLGRGPWLICRAATAPGAWPGPLLRTHLDEPRLAPFRAALSAWLEARGAEAVLVRPDRQVFGAGPPHDLERAFGAALGLRETAPT